MTLISLPDSYYIFDRSCPCHVGWIRAQGYIYQRVSHLSSRHEQTQEIWYLSFFQDKIHISLYCRGPCRLFMYCACCALQHQKPLGTRFRKWLPCLVPDSGYFIPRNIPCLTMEQNNCGNFSKTVTISAMRWWAGPVAWYGSTCLERLKPILN